MSEKQEQMTMPAHGTFCWMELNSTNVEACKTFYTQLFGWNLSPSKAIPADSPVEYTEFGVGEQRIGGMMQIMKECPDGTPSHWSDMSSHWRSYVAVDNVDESAAKVEEFGGKVCVPPMDIPNVGRFSVVTDPSGAMLSLITLKQ